MVLRGFSARASDWLAIPPQAQSLFALLCDSRSTLELQLVETLLSQLAAPDVHKPTPQQQHLVEKLLNAEPLAVCFINDNGFYAGAGIATARQARSFALGGHQVSVIGLNPYPLTALSSQRYRHWLQGDRTTTNMRFHAARQATSQLDRSGAHDSSALVTALLEEEKWDLVVLGNLHSEVISLRFLEPLLQRQTPMIWYAHDLDLLGGGCGYPQYYECLEHLRGCWDQHCPKPITAYPQSANGRVRQSYLQRSLLTEHLSLQLACQSNWSQVQLLQRFPQRPVLRIPLGVDTSVFRPVADRTVLRHRLGLDPDRFTIVIGADSIGRPGKGGQILEALLPELLNDAGMQVVCFGHSPISHPQLVSCGYLESETAIAAVYASGDVFLNPVTIEAFGQTLLEAAACGCVPVALRCSGVVDVVAHGRSGLLVDAPLQLHAALEKLRRNPELRALLAAEGRQRIEQEFSLERQYDRWLDSLCRIWATPRNSRRTPPKTPEQPLISILSTTLNCAEALAPTAASLAMQCYTALEWVVQDGCSNDGTLELVVASGMPHRIQQQPDNGIYDAANQAIPHCQGEWVLVLQAGDLLAGPNAISRVMASVDHANADLIVAEFMEVLVDGTSIRRCPANPAHKLQQLRDGRYQRSGPHWLSGMPSHQALLLRRSWLERFPFNTELRIAADWQQLLAVVNAGANIAMSNQLLSWYPNGGYSYTHSDQWIADVIQIAKQYQPDHTAVESYFAPALHEHRQCCLQRRQRQQALRRWYPDKAPKSQE